MKFINITVIALSITLVQGFAFASSEKNYLDIDGPFISAKNINDEVQAWAVCAAGLKVLSEILKEDKPNTATQLNNLANGASLSILMSQVSRLISIEEIDIKKLNATIEYGKLQMDEMPKVEQSRILSDLELSGAEVMMEKLTKTMNQCIENNESQKMYVEMMRELAKSGVFN